MFNQYPTNFNCKIKEYSYKSRASRSQRFKLQKRVEIKQDYNCICLFLKLQRHSGRVSEYLTKVSYQYYQSNITLGEHRGQAVKHTNIQTDALGILPKIIVIKLVTLPGLEVHYSDRFLHAIITSIYSLCNSLPLFDFHTL